LQRGTRHRKQLPTARACGVAQSTRGRAAHPRHSPSMNPHAMSNIHGACMASRFHFSVQKTQPHGYQAVGCADWVLDWAGGGGRPERRFNYVKARRERDWGDWIDGGFGRWPTTQATAVDLLTCMLQASLALPISTHTHTHTFQPLGERTAESVRDGYISVATGRRAAVAPTPPGTLEALRLLTPSPFLWWRCVLDFILWSSRLRTSPLLRLAQNVVSQLIPDRFSPNLGTLLPVTRATHV
jgi:hypothetical protein